MKIIIAGCGKAGTILARQLAAEGHDLTLIDTKADVCELIQERYDVMCIQGNCASMPVLKQAGIMDADILVAMAGADEINLLCCTTAYGMNERVHTIARIRNPEYTDQIFKMRSLFGLSMMVNPERQAALEIERLIKYPGFLKRDTFAKGRVEIVELRVSEKSKICNMKLIELGASTKAKILICAILRNGKAIIPDGNEVLLAGDRIFVTASPEELTAFLKYMGVITHKAKRALICGGGRLSFYLAQILDRDGIMVEIIEQDHEKCVNLANYLPNVTVVHGDASNEFLLESEGIHECDVLITMTGLDELNIIISMFGNQCRVPQVITKLGRLDNNSILDSLGLGSVVSPKELCCNSIVRYVRAVRNQTGAALALHMIADGQAEAIEFLVDENTLHCKEPLKNLKIKKNIRIASISSNSAHYEVPNGDSTFAKGDRIIIVSSGDEIIYQINDIFL